MGLEDYSRFYNGLRPHQVLGYRTPAEGVPWEPGDFEGESTRRRCSPGEEIESLERKLGPSLDSALILSK